MSDKANNIASTFGEIVNVAQSSAATHPKCLQQVKKLYENNELEAFLKALKNSILHFLRVDVKVNNPFVERILNFLGEACGLIETQHKAKSNEEEVESKFISCILEFLLERAEFADVGIRFRACQLLNKILDNLIGIQLSIDICDKIQGVLLKRMKDRKMAIRIQAGISIRRLQDCSSACPIIEMYKETISLDSSAKVRMTCINNVALRADVIPHIIERTRDVDYNVRLAVYKKILDRPHYLKIEQKRILIKAAAQETHQSVQTFIETKLIPSWLTYYKNNYLNLLKALRLDSDFDDLVETVEVAEYVLKILFRNRPFSEISEVLNFDENNLLPLEDLNWESILFWRFYLECIGSFYFETNAMNLPNLVDFCKYIQLYYSGFKGSEDNIVEYVECQYILWHFFHMTKKFDFGDSASRYALNLLIKDMLINATLYEEVVGIVMENLDYIIPSTTEQVKFVCDVISEIMTPTMSEEKDLPQDIAFEIAQLKMKSYCLKHDLDTFISERDFLKADALQKQLDKITNQLEALQKKKDEESEEEVVINNNVSAIMKYLDIINAFMSSPKVKSLDNMLQSIKTILFDLLIHENVEIQLKALKGYGLFCIVDLDCAQQGIHIFCSLFEDYLKGEHDKKEVLLCALKVIIDLITLFGPNLIANQHEGDVNESCNEEMESVFNGGSSLTAVVKGLIELLEDKDTDIQEWAGNGLCYLISGKRINSHVVMSKLILKWCHPTKDIATERLQQRIGHILKTLPSQPECVMQLEKAILLVIKAISKAHNKGPLQYIDPVNIAKFLLELCNCSANGAVVHSNLAINICVEIRDNPTRKYAVLYSRILLMLTLPKDKIFLTQLLKLCDDIQNETHNRLILNNIRKLKAEINSYDLF